MNNEEAINNLNMIRIAFIMCTTKEQEELIDDTFNIAIKALAKHEYFIDKINRESYIRGYNKAMSNILLAYDKSDYPEESNYYVYQELNKWEEEGVPNEQ